MAKQRLMLLLGAFCILLIVVGYVNLNSSPDVTDTAPEDITLDNSTISDPKDTETEASATDNSTISDGTEAKTEDNTSTNNNTNGNTDTTAETTNVDNEDTSNSTEIKTEDTTSINGNNDTITEVDTPDNSTTSDTTDSTINPTDETDNSSNDAPSNPLNTTKPETPQPNEEDHEDDDDYTWDNSTVTTIMLNTDSISVDNQNGTIINETTILITSAGTYSISGTLEDGQIIVDTNDIETVKLILNGVNISSTTNAPVYIEDAEKTVIILADNTENFLKDNENNVDNGTLASRDNLSIYGNGSLTVCGNANDAIRSNDGLIIKSGNISVTSVDDGIRGKDYLVIKGGNITVNSVGDGLKSDNNEEEDRGYISIEGGKIDIISTQGDAISAQTDLLVTGGTIALTSGSGSNAFPDEKISTKGLKAGLFIIIDDGYFTINSSDDAIHSNHMIIINNGTYHIASGDDGIHADTSLEINNGTVEISQSFEGIESESITINDGYINVTASDDGFNAVGTSDGSTQDGDGWGRGWGDGFDETGEFYLYINGGLIVIDSGGDGLDTGGYLEMNDGFVIVNGPVPGSFPNGAIDYGFGTFKLTGGTIVAVASADMPQTPTPELSTQYSVLMNLRSPQLANTLVNIQTASGETVLTFRPTKRYQSIFFSSPELTTGSYKVYLGGTSTGCISYGVYEDGTYTPGTEYTSFTISEIVTIVGGGGMFWGP